MLNKRYIKLIKRDDFNQVFGRKNLVIKMMNVGGRVGVNNSFPEHNSATVKIFK